MINLTDKLAIQGLGHKNCFMANAQEIKVYRVDSRNRFKVEITGNEAFELIKKVLRAFDSKIRAEDMVFETLSFGGNDYYKQFLSFPRHGIDIAESKINKLLTELQKDKDFSLFNFIQLLRYDVYQNFRDALVEAEWSFVEPMLEEYKRNSREYLEEVFEGEELDEVEPSFFVKAIANFVGFSKYMEDNGDAVEVINTADDIIKITYSRNKKPFLMAEISNRHKNAIYCKY